MSEIVPNVVRFARVLRAAGVPVATAQVIAATRALEAVDLTQRSEVYWSLHATLVTRREQHAVFDLAFRQFFRDPIGGIEAALAALLPKMDGRAPPPAASRRVAEAMGTPKPTRARGRAREEEPEEIALAPSDLEVLRTRDFEAMSADELARAKRAIARLRLAQLELPTRRFEATRRGSRLALRATLRASLRGGRGIDLRFLRPKTRRPALVVLCDISGSMERYARVLLHFVHALTNDRDRVSTFLFGTHLTPVSRELAARDVDVALARVGKKATDWSGGTRIATALGEFNRRWARRLLAPGAVVLLVTDGLDRDDGRGLAFEMDRLHRSCRRLVWLNPLLRYAGFEPRAAGIRAMLPHVDEHRPCHDLASLEALVAALGVGPPGPGRP
ncbi:MAG: VWA domain-containing protein [Deltaproteobacteria bacterium]|nr:VWA domain-containing protein [Deltaproteobacteria bacterium]